MLGQVFELGKILNFFGNFFSFIVAHSPYFNLFDYEKFFVKLSFDKTRLILVVEGLIL